MKPLHIAAWLAAAVAAFSIATDEDPPAAQPVAVAQAPVAVDPWRPAAGNLAPGVELYFGRHDRIYRGTVMGFVDTDLGEAAVLLNDGRTEVMLRKDIAIRDFWVRAD